MIGKVNSYPHFNFTTTSPSARFSPSLSSSKSMTLSFSHSLKQESWQWPLVRSSSYTWCSSKCHHFFPNRKLKCIQFSTTTLVQGPIRLHLELLITSIPVLPFLLLSIFCFPESIQSYKNIILLTVVYLLKIFSMQVNRIKIYFLLCPPRLSSVGSGLCLVNQYLFFLPCATYWLRFCYLNLSSTFPFRTSPHLGHSLLSTTCPLPRQCLLSLRCSIHCYLLQEVFPDYPI